MEKDIMLESINSVFLISAFAFIREPLRLAGYCVEEGIILVVNNTALCERVVGELLGFNGIKLRLRLNGVIDAANYQLAITTYDRAYKPEVLQNFMSQTSFLPVVLAKGIIPHELRPFKNVLVIEDIDTDPTLRESRKAIFEEFIKYVTDDSLDLLSELKSARRIAERETRQWFSDVPGALGAVTSVVYDYACKRIGVSNEKKIHDFIMARYRRLISAYCRGDTEIDMLESVCRCLADYLDAHEEVFVGEIDRTEEEFWNACEEDRAIVYDASSYFLSDRILRDSMSEITVFIPYIRIKQELKDCEALICNTGETDGFTVKKVFWRPDGRLIRPRVLRLSREHFDGLIHPDIAARRWVPCTSVSTRIEP